MSFRIFILLLLFSPDLLSQTITRGEIERIPKRGLFRRHPKPVVAQESTRFVQEGNRLTTFTKMLVPGTGKSEWRMMRVADYENGEPHGVYIEFDVQGDTSSYGHYWHGRYCGPWYAYTAGIVSSLRTYDSLGNKSGLQYQRNQNGIITSKSYYYHPDDYYQWTYSESGFLISRGRMKTVGKEETWYNYPYIDEMKSPADTVPILISQWHNGLAHGKWLVYSAGMLVREQSYDHNSYHGVHREYQNGVLRLDELWEHGRLDATKFVYSATGKLMETDQYNEGVQNGKHIFYDTLTKVAVETKTYRAGLLVNHEQRTPGDTVVYLSTLISEDSMYYRFTEYYRNGKLKMKGSFVNDEPSGKFERWYENGKRKMISHYYSGRHHGRIRIWNEQGILVYTATVSFGEAQEDELVYDDNGRYIPLGSDGYDQQTDKYVPEDLQVFGDFQFRIPTVVVKTRNPFGRGKTSNDYEVIEEIQLLPLRTTAPQFPGGDSAFIAWFSGQLRYPPMEREMGIEGTSFVQFTVNTDGTISDVEIARGVPNGANCDKEAMRVVKQMPKWKPAMRKGKAVKSKCVVPVRWVIL